MSFKELLNSKGYTYGSLARKIDYSRQAVFSWASGRCAPDPETILKIKDILQVSAEEVLLCFVNDKGGSNG